MFQGALGKAEFDWWNQNGLESLSEQLRNNANIIKIELPGRKKRRFVDSYYTFIGYDAVKAIREYFPHRPKGGEAIFYTQRGTVLTADNLALIWTAHLKRLGVIQHVKGKGGGTRYGLGLHELRDLFRTQWERSSASGTVAEYCMGHVIDEHGYNQIWRNQDYMMEQYMLAESMLNVMSSETPYGLVKLTHEQIQFQETFADMLKDPDVQDKFLEFLNTLKK
jgi:hypothetical protein